MTGRYGCRRYVQSRCSKCQLLVSSTELVMRVKQLVFHVNCFTCHVCSESFSRGQQMALVGDNIYCTAHYQQLLASLSAVDDLTSPSGRAAFYVSSRRRRARKRSARPHTTTDKQHTTTDTQPSLAGIDTTFIPQSAQSG